MSFLLFQQNLPFQTMRQFLRYWQPSAPTTPELWANRHSQNIQVGDLLFFLDPIYSPWGDSTSGIGVSEGDSFKVAQACLVLRSEGGLSALLISGDRYESQPLEQFLAVQAAIAKSNGGGFYYAVGRKQQPVDGATEQHLAEIMSRYGGTGSRTNNELNLPDPVMTFLTTLGLRMDATESVLDVGQLAFLLFSDKEPPAGARLPDMREVFAPCEGANERADAASSAADSFAAAMGDSFGAGPKPGMSTTTGERAALFMEIEEDQTATMDAMPMLEKFRRSQERLTQEPQDNLLGAIVEAAESAALNNNTPNPFGLDAASDAGAPPNAPPSGLLGQLASRALPPHSPQSAPADAAPQVSQNFDEQAPQGFPSSPSGPASSSDFPIPPAPSSDFPVPPAPSSDFPIPPAPSSDFQAPQPAAAPPAAETPPAPTPRPGRLAIKIPVPPTINVPKVGAPAATPPNMVPPANPGPAQAPRAMSAGPAISMPTAADSGSFPSMEQPPTPSSGSPWDSPDINPENSAGPTGFNKVLGSLSGPKFGGLDSLSKLGGGQNQQPPPLSPADIFGGEPEMSAPAPAPAAAPAVPPAPPAAPSAVDPMLAALAGLDASQFTTEIPKPFIPPIVPVVPVVPVAPVEPEPAPALEVEIQPAPAPVADPVSPAVPDPVADPVSPAVPDPVSISSPSDAPTPQVKISSPQITVPAPPVDPILATFGAELDEPEPRDADARIEPPSSIAAVPPRKKRGGESTPMEGSSRISALKDPLNVKSGVAGLVSKLEQQATKASSRLEQQLEDISDTLNTEFSGAVQQVRESEKASIEKTNELRVGLSDRLQKAMDDVRVNIGDKAVVGRVAIERFVEEGKEAVDVKNSVLTESLNESFEEVRVRAEVLARSFEETSDAQRAKAMADLRQLMESLATQFSEANEYYSFALDRIIEHVNEQVQDRSKSTAQSLRNNYEHLDNQLGQVYDRARKQLDHINQDVLSRLGQSIQAAELDFVTARLDAVQTQLTPQLRLHRDTLRALIGEFQSKLISDLETKGAEIIEEFAPILDDKKQQISDVISHTSKIRESVEERQRYDADRCDTDFRTFVEDTIDDAKAKFTRTEEQIAEMDRSVRVLCDPANIEGDADLLTERESVLERMDMRTSDAAQEIHDSLKTNVAALEERAKQLQEELISRLEEDAYLVRKASEQALIRINTSIKEAFVSIQTAQDEQME